MTEASTDRDRNAGWLAADGWSVLALAGIVTIILTLIALPLGTFALGLMIWLRYTLRVPSRMSPQDTGLVLAPADGRILEITKLDDMAAGPAGRPSDHDRHRACRRAAPAKPCRRQNCRQFPDTGPVPGGRQSGIGAA